MGEQSAEQPQSEVKKVDNIAEIQKHHQRIIEISTTQLNDYLRIKTIVPELEIKNDDGPGAQTGEKDGKETVILRPHIWLENERRIPTGVTIHEVAHILGDKFVGLNPKRNTDLVWYLNDGFADFITVDDPANIRPALGIDKETGSYERIRREVVADSSLGETMVEYLAFDKLFAVRQPELEGENLPEQLDNKTLVPYWVGSSLVRFIVENGGLKELREIMREVQIKKKFGHGWSSSKQALPKQLKPEEARVRLLLKNAIKKQFGDVEEFEKQWKEAVLGVK